MMDRETGGLVIQGWAGGKITVLRGFCAPESSMLVNAERPLGDAL